MYMNLLMLYPCIQFLCNRTVGYGYIALEDFGDTESLITNAVVLVLAECHISMAKYLRGYLPSYKIVLQCIGN